MRAWLLAGLLSVLAAGAHAQESGWSDAAVAPCDDMASARYVAEPWAENTATYSNDAVRVALLDAIEPATASFRLLVLSPPHDESGRRQCWIIGHGGGFGFSDVDFAGHTASYDPATGLTLVFTVREPVQDMTTDDGWFLLGVRINQQSGRVTLQAMH